MIVAQGIPGSDMGFFFDRPGHPFGWRNTLVDVDNPCPHLQGRAPTLGLMNRTPGSISPNPTVIAIPAGSSAINGDAV
jgi:hypothetical protein